MIAMPLRILLTSIALVLSSLAAAAQSPYGGRAMNFYIVDMTSGQVLAQRNADVPLPPASMSKLMTLALLFDALAEGRVTMDSTWSVSQRAHQMGGSSMFLETRDRPTTEDLIHGIVTVSGNDATVVVAEGLAGSEEAFARHANQRALEMGMTNTSIANASGWPHPMHRMSLHDLAILAEYLLTEHAVYYHYLGVTSFRWNDIEQPNRLPLLGAGVGVDGLKTGHTEEAGYSMVGSAVQGPRRIVFVFSGLNSAAERAEEAERIVTWAFRQFSERALFDAGQTVTRADVWMGAQNDLPLVTADAVSTLVPVITQGDVAVRVEYEGPLRAPVEAGQQVANLVIEVPGLEPRTLPLLAGESVAEGGFVPRIRTAAAILGERFGLIEP